MTSRSFPTENIASRILLVRRQKVMLDAHLAELYGVTTKALIQAVRRNLNRFPSDFMFVLTDQDVAILRSQIVTSSWGGRRTLPYAFTEQGVAMLSSVLNSERAVQVNIAIMRAFVKLREILTTHRELAEKIAELENKYRQHDDKIQAVFDAIRELLEPPQVSPKRRIGFRG